MSYSTISIMNKKSICAIIQWLPSKQGKRKQWISSQFNKTICNLDEPHGLSGHLRIRSVIVIDFYDITISGLNLVPFASVLVGLHYYSSKALLEIHIHTFDARWIRKQIHLVVR